MKKIFLFIATLFLLVSTLSIATVRYVSHSGSNTPPYTNWATAADSIMSAINISVFGDTIYVANGVYEEEVLMIAGLSLLGAGMDSCIISQPSYIQYNCVVMNDNCTINGFSLEPAHSHSVGIKVTDYSDSIKIRNMLIPACRFGIKFKSSGGLVENCILSNVGHTAINQDLFWYFWDLKIINNVIETDYNGISLSSWYNEVNIISNYIFLSGAAYQGIVMTCTIPKQNIFNNLIMSNASMYDPLMGMRICWQYHTRNNIIFNGFQASSVNLGVLGDSTKEFINNIIMNGNKGLDVIGQNDSVKIQYNNFWNNNVDYISNTPLDSTNLFLDPMIVSEDSLDFHLQMYSPLIDAGDPKILDLDGSRSDIGLWGGPYGEIYTYRDLAPKPPSNLTAEYDSGLVKLTWNKNTESDFYRYLVYRDTIPNFMYDTTKIIAVVADTFYYDDIPEKYLAGNYYYKLTAIDSTGHQSAPGEEVQITVTGIPEAPPIVIEHYQLLNNYPNPFNSSTVIPYRLKEAGYVKLYVYDIKGELVRTLINEYQSAGYYEVKFSPSSEERKNGELGEGWWTGYNDDIATGIYIYQLMVRGEGDIPVFSDIKKMILLK